jgi:hypothetical protein
LCSHSVVSRRIWNPSSLPRSQELHASTPPHPVSARSILILSNHLRLGLPIGLFLDFPPSAYTPFSSPTFMLRSRTSHPSRLNCSNYTWQRAQMMQLLVMHFLESPVTSSVFGRFILIGTLLSNTLSLCSSLNVRHEA